jgi:hypothetical protein
MPRAIDVHVHPPSPEGESLLSSEAARQYFRAGAAPSSAEEMAEYYARLDIIGVIFDIDAETATGRPPTPNDYIAGIAETYPKQPRSWASRG